MKTMTHVTLLTALLLHVTHHVTGADLDSNQDGDQSATANLRMARSPQYMRFGRALGVDVSDEGIHIGDDDSEADDRFYKRGDNDLIEAKRESMFPRIGPSMGKRGTFPRFGRAAFPRFGKRAAGFPRFGRAHWPRFGKREGDFLRFGRMLNDAGDDDLIKRMDPLIRFGKRADPRLRFGKRRDPMFYYGKRLEPRFRFGKRESREPVLRFGKRNMEEDEAEVVDADEELSHALSLGWELKRLRFGKRRDPMFYYGKRLEPRFRFGKREMREPVLRFGKRNMEDDEAEVVDADEELSRVARSAATQDNTANERSKRAAVQTDAKR